MSALGTAKTAARTIARRVPGLRPAWHAALRLNGQARARLRSLGDTWSERRRRVRESRPIDHPTPRTRRELAVLELANRLSRRPAVDPSSAAVVTMTTHGERLKRVYLPLESIARGVRRPGRLILWLDDPEAAAHLPRPLKRLQRRGLEVRLAPNYKVHTKYYPYVVAFADDERPLVTADDDILYPPEWLLGLLDAHARHPDDIIAYRAHRMSVTDGVIDPYPSWRPAEGTEASAAFFGTSVSGQVFPPALQRLAASRGEEFREKSPDNDDIWLHAIGVASGIRVRLVDGVSRMFTFLPGSQQSGLYLTNYWDGANDRQITASYVPEAVRAVEADLASSATAEAG